MTAEKGALSGPMDLAFAPYHLYTASLSAAQQGLTAFVHAYALAMEGVYTLTLQQMRFATGVGQVMAAAAREPDDPVRAEEARDGAASAIGATVWAARKVEVAQHPAPAAVRLAAVRAISRPPAAA
jgi:hypothetical protein